MPRRPAFSTMMFQPLLHWLRRTSLVTQIVIGLILHCPGRSGRRPRQVGLLGTLFISALKAVAPVLVLVLVMAAIGNHRPGKSRCSSPCCGCIGGHAGGGLVAWASMLSLGADSRMQPPASPRPATSAKC
jgi:Na+/serine symporter